MYLTRKRKSTRQNNKDYNQHKTKLNKKTINQFTPQTKKFTQSY